MFEVWVHHSVGETFTTNTDTFQYTVTGKLVHDKVSINNTWHDKVYIRTFAILKQLKDKQQNSMAQNKKNFEPEMKSKERRSESNHIVDCVAVQF